jgi:hypothetical protein
MVLTVSFALSPATGLFCHRHQRSCLCQFDASVGASGPHDFAVRKRAPSSEAPPASTASRPASVTIAIRPSRGTRRWGYKSDLLQRRTEIFLQMRLDGHPKSADRGRVPNPQNKLSMMNLEKCIRALIPATGGQVHHPSRGGRASPHQLPFQSQR